MPSEENAAKARVFVSHALDDPTGNDVAQRLASALIAFGARVWIAPDTFRTGPLWNAAIVSRLIDQSTHFLVVLSAASITSREVLREIELARQRWERDSSYAIVPIFCEPVPDFPGAKFLSEHCHSASRRTFLDRHAPSLPPDHRALNTRRLGCPINVAFVTPSILRGGTEYWFLALAKYSNPTRVRWHVALTNAAMQDASLVEQIRQYAPVAVGRRSIAELLVDMNAVLVWGLYRPKEWIGDFSGPVVAVAHSSGDSTEPWLRYAKQEATHRAAVSHAAARSFGACPVHVIANGIDPDRCRALVAREDARARWGLRPTDIAVGYVGRISSEKNCTAVADVVRALGPPYRAVFVGPTYDSSYLRRVRAAAPSGIFVPAVDHVGDAFAALDVLLMLSRQEGGPLVVLEAVLAGVPVVATGVGLLPSIVAQHGELFVTVSTSPTCAEACAAVQRALSPAWRSVLPRAAQVIRQNFTAARMARDWTDYLSSIIAR